MRNVSKDYKEIGTLGFNLKTEREKRGWTQRYTAKTIGVSCPCYQNWEQGITKYLRPEHFDRLKVLFESQTSESA